jgi:hypothetical protein
LQTSMKPRRCSKICGLDRKLCCLPHTKERGYFRGLLTSWTFLVAMGKELVATLTDGDNRTRAAPMFDWLRAACTILGAARENRCHSILHVNLEATTPDARVVKNHERKIGSLPKTRLFSQIPQVECQLEAPQFSRQVLLQPEQARRNVPFLRPPRYKLLVASMMPTGRPTFQRYTFKC